MASGNHGPRRHFNYSNVMSTLAVFLVVSGGTAMAAKIEDSGDIAKQVVKNSDVTKNTLKSNRLRDGKAVRDQDVVPNSLTGNSIDESTLEISQQVLPTSLPPSGPAGGDLTGEYPDPTIADNAVSSAKIADGTVGNADLADNAVDAAKIQDGTVGAAEIDANAVDSAEIATGAVKADELGTLRVRVTEVALPEAGSASAHASCDAGEQLVSGGGNVGVLPANGDDLQIVSSRPVPNAEGAVPTIWRVTAANFAGGVAATVVKAYALCLES